MKYGKEFQQILDDPSIPQEWRRSAIEYGKLKKLIKDVVAELSGMGLSPDVLHKLLSTETLGVPDKSGEGDESSGAERETPDEGDILEFEFESPDNSPPTLHSFPSTTTREAQEVVVAPVRHEDDAGPSFGVDSQGHHHRTFRLRLLSETQAEKPVELKPMGVMDMFNIQTQKRRSSVPHSAKMPSEKDKRGRRHVRRAVVDEQGGVKAEYVLVGDPANPRPQLRLHLSATSSPDRHETSSGPSSRSASQSGDTTTESDTDPITSESEDEPDDEPIIVRPTRILSPQHTPRAFSYRSSPRAVPDMDVIPPSPTLQRLRQAISPIWALASGNNINDGLRDLSLDEAGPSRRRRVSPTSHSPDSPTTPKAELNSLDVPVSQSVNGVSGTMEEISTGSASERDFIIPLASDVLFFNILTSALTSLSAFHATQQEAFKRSVDVLCGLIRTSIHPGDAPIVMPTPYNPTPRIGSAYDDDMSMRQPSQRASKKDLYAWREIFSLWIEHEIFESSAERTRGERTVEEAQARLQTFANEVVKRGLGDRRTIRGKKARGAWEEFLRLNVLLLDLKRFQMANINAARKILKKHDKRTALTASAGFPSFVRSTLANSVDHDGNVLTWNFYSTSLPHVLLASLTDTLLPILPSLDDYACLICTSIAFKPIRLGCGHLFCVRCLVKMQRAGKAECPLCRSKVVLLADKHSLDKALMGFMKDWFPKEVKEKQKENDREIAFEQAGGPEADRCVVM